MTAAALVLGVVTALAHLQVLAWRARAVGGGRLAVSVGLAPLGLVVPLVGLAVVLRLAPQAAWAFLLGLIAGRVLGLARMAREDRWMR